MFPELSLPNLHHGPVRFAYPPDHAPSINGDRRCRMDPPESFELSAIVAGFPTDFPRTHIAWVVDQLLRPGEKVLAAQCSGPWAATGDVTVWARDEVQYRELLESRRNVLLLLDMCCAWCARTDAEMALLEQVARMTAVDTRFAGQHPLEIRPADELDWPPCDGPTFGSDPSGFSEDPTLDLVNFARVHGEPPLLLQPAQPSMTSFSLTPPSPAVTSLQLRRMVPSYPVLLNQLGT